MIPVDLVTGFLGSGKTTFITEYAKHLSSKGLKTAVIVNDYGAINVDRMMLTKSLEGVAHVEMFIGGDMDCSRRRLKTKLIALAMDKYEYVIIEPSGVFDTDDFLDLIYDEPLDKWYRMGSIISIVSSELDMDMSYESRYLLASQTAKAGTVVYSKPLTERYNEILDYINNSLAEFKCERTIREMYCWNLGSITSDEFERISESGYTSGDMIKLPVVEDGQFSSEFFFHVETPIKDLQETIKGIFNDEEAGNIYRLKGYILNKMGVWLEVNATKNNVSVVPVDVGQEVFIVIGENLDAEKIGAHWDAYRNVP